MQWTVHRSFVGLLLVARAQSWTLGHRRHDARRNSGRIPLSTRSTDTRSRHALSGDFLENDLVAVRHTKERPPRLCAVNPDGVVIPLCLREDDVETDLFADPREFSKPVWEEATDMEVEQSYGEGLYGQRPVPSLGGGPGYGADADEVWSVEEDVLAQVRADGVEIPVLDVGIAHGEKARGGSF